MNTSYLMLCFFHFLINYMEERRTGFGCFYVVLYTLTVQ